MIGEGKEKLSEEGGSTPTCQRGSRPPHPLQRLLTLSNPSWPLSLRVEGGFLLFGRKNVPLEASFQIDHINELLSIFIYGMVVIISKEVFNDMRSLKAARFIKIKCAGDITCPYI